MSVTVKIATTTRELDDVFHLRHRVFVDQERYFTPRPDHRITDRFDAYPTTVNFVAVVDQCIVGALRVVEDTRAGSPTDEFFDFRPYLTGEHRFSSGSMLCAERAHRKTPRLVFTLVAMSYHWSRTRGHSRMAATVNPDHQGFFGRIGGRQIAEPVWHDELGLGAIPILIELDSLPTAFAAFLARQPVVSHPDSFERELLERGETLQCGSEHLGADFIVLDGRIAIDSCQRGARPPQRLAELGAGDRVNERDLSPPPEQQSTQLTALSRTELMIIDPAPLEHVVAPAA